jgi:hypothetical protein
MNALRLLTHAISHLINAVLMGVVRAYRFFLSPWLGSACRFTPTCSAYALQALDQHGPGVGSYLAARRLLRCHPLCAGGHDPVPAQPVRLFSRLFSSSSSSERPHS